MKEALRKPLHGPGVRADQGVNAVNGGKKGFVKKCGGLELQEIMERRE